MKILDSINKLFEGRKTYLVAAVAAFVVFAQYSGWIDDKTYETVIGLLGATGLATLRAAK